MGNEIFNQCIFKSLATKTRILITHQLHVLPKVDLIIIMEHGKIVAQGSFNDLMTNNTPFNRLMDKHGGLETEDTKSSIMSLSSPLSPKLEDELKQKEFMILEEKNIGSIGSNVYHGYILLAGGSIVYYVTFINIVLAQGVRIMTDKWLTLWTSKTLSLSTQLYIIIYILIGFAQTIFVLVFGWTNAYYGARASKKVHEKALEGLFRAPILFFDTTPLGRITSRFSRDIGMLFGYYRYIGHHAA